jgi:hypothetical protein
VSVFIAAFLVAACGGAGAPEQSTVATESGRTETDPPSNDPDASGTYTRIGASRIALDGLDGLRPLEDKDGLQDDAENVTVLIIPLEAPYGPETVAEATSGAGWIGFSSDTPRQSITIDEGREATLVVEDEDEGRTWLLVTGDATDAVAVVAAVAVTETEWLARVDRAIRTARWLPRAP